MIKSKKAKPAVKTVTVKSHVRKVKTSRSKAVAVKPMTPAPTMTPSEVLKRLAPERVKPKASKLNGNLTIIQRKEIELNDELILITEIAKAKRVLNVRCVSVVVTGETEKALQVTAISEDGTPGFPCWVPKSAMESSIAKGCYQLADWFTNGANSYVMKWLHFNSRNMLLAG